MSRYTYCLTFSGLKKGKWQGEWKIIDMGDKGYTIDTDPVVFAMPALDGKAEFDMPKEFKEKFEALNGRPEFVNFDEDEACGTTDQIVEMIDDGPIFNQPCKFGCLVPGHSVYCHNRSWLYAPRKCHRTWYTGGEERDEDCPGYKPNPKLNSAQTAENGTSGNDA